MIDIKSKNKCCGCSACVQICPKECICFEEDNEGFWYPVVNTEKCINCGLCEKVCPVLHPFPEQKHILAMAAINLDYGIRSQSSSGGLFSLLASKVIKENGVVFGARFDENWEVIHDFTETLDGLSVFRGAKYLQSKIANTYQVARSFLEMGRKVLYSGTPCQIAGLKTFLQKEYDNLFAIEVVCHSIPSPLIWRLYLRDIAKGQIVKDINFRNKDTGWSNYAYNMCVQLRDGNIYREGSSGSFISGMTKNLTTRPSCSECKFRKGKSSADISLGDCWGIWDLDAEFNDNKGVSLLIAYSNRVLPFLNSLKMDKKIVNLEDFKAYNEGLCSPTQSHTCREDFFAELDKIKHVKIAIDSYLKVSKYKCFGNCLKNGMKKAMLYLKK